MRKRINSRRDNQTTFLHLALILVSLTSLAAIRGEEPRFQLFRDAVSAESKLARLECDRYAPAEAADYRRALRAAAAELKRQEETLFLFRNYTEFNGRAALALSAAESAMDAARRKKVELSRAVGERLAAQKGSVREMRRAAGRVGLSRRLRERLTRAEVILRESEILAADSRWMEAQEKLDQCESAGQPVQSGLDERLGRFSRPDLVDKWSRWVRNTLSESARGGGCAIVVDKSAAACLLVQAGRVVQTYRAEFGVNGIFDKTSQGDGGTPEGRYRIVRKNPASKYYKALVINYPNADDLREFRIARARGRLHPGARIGGLIELHGRGGKSRNWTQGCVALTDADISNLYRRVAVGTPVTIVGRASLQTLLASR